MPRRPLTNGQLNKFWDTFPYGDHGQRMQAIARFEREHGQPLPEDDKRAALWRYSPELKAQLGIRKVFAAPMDIGVEAGLKFQQQLLDESHYDLLLNETGMVQRPDSDDALCILLKNVLPQS